MPEYRASFCDPFQKEIIELGRIEESGIIRKFESIPWHDYLKRMENAHQKEIHYSPSLEIENKENKHGLTISAVGEPGNPEFYIFYKRPKTIKRFFGLQEKVENDFMTDKTGQTWQDAIDCLDALVRNDLEYLASKIGN